MQSQFIYASVPTQPMGSYELIQLVEQAQRNNRKSDITGMLAYSGHWFLQVLEGERAIVDATFARIEIDRRHRDIHVIGVVESPQRRFATWSMGFAGLDAFNEDLILEHCGMRTLAPRQLAAPAALALLVALSRKSAS